MATNVESMFYVREIPWRELGTRVMEVPTLKKRYSWRDCIGRLFGSL